MKPPNLKLCSWMLFVVYMAACAALGLTAWYRGDRLDSAWQFILIAWKGLAAVPVISLLFVKFMWRWKIFSGWLVPFPDLTGTWTGHIVTTLKDPLVHSPVGPIPAMLTIRQTFLSISCVLKTAEMTSRSSFEGIVVNDEQQLRQLGFTYTSTPRPSVAARSEQHEGTAVLDLLGNPVNKLTGRYWTNRKTTGELTLKRHSSDLLSELPPDLGFHPVSDIGHVEADVPPKL